MRIAAGVRIVEANQQISDGRFAGAAGAENGADGSRGHAKRQIHQHVIRGVTKGDAIELDFAANFGQTRKIRALDDSGLRIEQFPDARQGDAAGDEVRVQAHQVLHRREQAQVICHQRHQRSGGESAVDHQLAAVEKNRRGGQRQHRSRHSAAQKRSQLHAHQRVDEAPVALPESIRLARFGVRGDDQTDSQQRFEQKAADVGAALADGADAIRQAALIVLQAPRD